MDQNSIGFNAKYVSTWKEVALVYNGANIDKAREIQMYNKIKYKIVLK